MATIINSDVPTNEDASMSAGAWAAVLGVLAVAVLIALFVWPGYMQSSPSGPSVTNIEVTTPPANNGGSATLEGNVVAPPTTSAPAATPSTSPTTTP